MMGKDLKDEYGLTLKQRIYADAFVLTGNKRASAIKAGAKPSSAGVIAARLSTNVNIERYVDMRRHGIAVILENDYGITRDRVLRELAAVAFLDPRKLYDDNGDLLPVHKMNEMTRRAIAAVDVQEITDSDGVLIGYTKRIKTSPKIAALELLGRHLRMWNDKDGGQGSILNIVIHKDRNLLDNPPLTRIIRNGSD
jgi:phage terminase small subunit